MNKYTEYPIRNPWHTMQRFWKFVDRRENGCWEWLGGKQMTGYGTFFYSKKTYGAHRFAWMLRWREWPPKDMCVCHICDNPSCVNPDHLFLATHKENMEDKVAKGRGTRGRIINVGMDAPRRKLTYKEVDAIRTFCSRNGRGCQAFAARWFGIKRAAVNKICLNTRWKESNGLQDTQG